MLRLPAVFAVALTLTACAETASTPLDPISAQLSGKTLVNESSSFSVNPDGSLIGKVGDEDFIGAWAIRDGQWCRTFETPARFAGTACQDITFNEDGTVTIDGVNRPQTFNIE